MKITLIVPPNNFLEYLKPELEKLGHRVFNNTCHQDTDVAIITSSSVMNVGHRLKSDFPHVPIITYNWDWYDHIDKKTGYWPRWIDLMQKSKEVWSASKITAQKCEKETGIKSNFWLYAYILPWEWEGKGKDEGYIIQASRFDQYKRFDWFERAAKELNIPYKSYSPHVNRREDYLQAVKNCTFLCVCSIEESLGGLTAMEASYCGKPVLISDFEGAKEVWENDVNYFHRNDFQDLKNQMTKMWAFLRPLSPFTPELLSKARRAKRRVERRFLPKHWAVQIDKRLKEIL